VARPGRLAASIALAAGAALVGPATSGADSVYVLRLVSITVSGTLTDTGKPGPSRGDHFDMKDTLVNAVRQLGKPKGARVGSDRARLELVSATKSEISGIARLPGGTVTFEGGFTVRAGGTFAVPIVGGTGRWAKARGTLTVYPPFAQNRTINVFRIGVPLTA